MITHINQDQPQVVMSKGFAIMICADPWSNGSAKLELAIYYGEPNRISRLKISGGVTSDLGSVITDCGGKHYNTAVSGIPKRLMVVWIRPTARRSIVTDHYLLVPARWTRSPLGLANNDVDLETAYISCLWHFPGR